VWARPLSGGRTVAAVINLFDEPQILTLDFQDVILQSARVAKDIWNNFTANNVLTSCTAHIDPHGTPLLELQGTTAAGFCTLTFARIILF
jgi:alpha-galactosidase